MTFLAGPGDMSQPSMVGSAPGDGLHVYLSHQRSGSSPRLKEATGGEFRVYRASIRLL